MYCYMPVSSLLLRVTGRSKQFLFGQVCVFASSRRFPLISDFNRRQSTSSGRPPRSSFSTPRILTKKRLIYIGIGVVVVGCLVGLDNYNTQSKEYNKKIIKILHSSVITAQNAVQNGKYEEAVEHYRKARVYVDHAKLSSASVQNKVVLNIVDQLGHLAYELENWEEAEEFLNESEKAMLQSGIEKDDDSYLEVILRLAVIDTKHGRKTEALERFEFCITTLEKKTATQDIYSEDYSDRLKLYGMALTEYGIYTKQIGQLDASEEALSKALNVCRSVLGPKHEQTSVLANDLATVYDEHGNFVEAIRLVEKAIEIATETAPGNLAVYKHNLGHILMHKGDTAKAQLVLHEASILAETNEDDETKELTESSITKLQVPAVS